MPGWWRIAVLVLIWFDPTALWESSLKTLGDLARMYGEIAPVSEDKIMAATDGMKLDLGRGLVLEMYLTPGHAVHHLSLFDRANSVLLAGEAAGVCINGQVRQATPTPFKLEETLSSIDKLIALEPQKLCYGHYGCYDDGLERLKRYREKLLVWHEVVTSAARAGKNTEQILSLLKDKDRDLAYLDDLTKDEYQRELGFIINSMNGFAGAVRDVR